ncbi:MAG: polyamine aminopropyltransferase [Gammaproteobacteria bacterium]|nr:polyamine aminopropyltransferase [Gammaproteobacteria bacterium]
MLANNPLTTPRFLPVLLAFCMFSTGASGLVNEYVLATLTTYILGNSIEQFSIVIASMMFMMGVSGLVQSKMSDNNLIQKFMLVEVCMAVLGGFAPLVIYAAYGYMDSHFLFVHYFFVLAVGFLIGFEIPIVMRIIEQNKVKLKTNLSIVYAMDYIGAFIGAVIWVKFLLKNYPLTEISFIVAGFNFAVALVTILYFIKTGVLTKKWQSVLIILATVILLVAGYASNRELSNLFEQRFYDDPIVHKETTKYQHLVITENKTNGDVRLYINGNTQFSSLDEQRYHDFLVHPAMTLVEAKKNILILGGGDGLALREVLKYKDIHTVTLVDLDPAMVELARTNRYLRQLNRDAFHDSRIIVQPSVAISATNVKGMYLSNGKGDAEEPPESQWVASVNVYNLDADLFINQLANQQWDVVIIDFPDPSSVELSKLYSKQFYKKLRRHLAPSAVVAIQSTSPYHAKEAFLSIGNTLKAAGYTALPYRQNIPSFGDWGFYLAWSGQQSATQVRQYLSKTDSFQVNTGFITPELMMASFAFGKGELLSKTQCINTIMQPCLLTQYSDYSWQIE